MLEKRSNSESFIVGDLFSPESRHKRLKTLVEVKRGKKLWIVFDKVKTECSNEWFQIEQVQGK